MSTAVVRLDEINAAFPHLCSRCRERLEELTVLRGMEAISVEGLDALLHRIAEEQKIDVEAIRSHRRALALVQARRDFCIAACKLGRYTYQEIGDAIGRHYTTVLYLVWGR